MEKVLWLTSWYPNRLDRFDGDFIQRHARAVSLYCKIHVIYVKKDTRVTVHTAETELQVNGNLTEQIIYYNSLSTGIRPLDKYLSQLSYKKYFRDAIRNYIDSTGKPPILHLHVAMKAGAAALWVKKTYKIPFIISEHWTAYLDEADQRISDYSYPFRRILKRVIKQSSSLTVVSNHLGKAIRKHFPAIQYEVIPNVVDTDIFIPSLHDSTGVTNFIHISNMNYQKNTEAILQAFSLLMDNCNCELYLYGPVHAPLVTLIDKLGLQQKVFVKGEVPQDILSKAIQQSDALILYSRFETFGCVLIEANACGIPVIVSDLAVLHELIEEGINGTFVETENYKALAEKIRKFILEKNIFDKNEIAAATAGKYNFNKVGKQFHDLYLKIKTDDRN